MKRYIMYIELVTVSYAYEDIEKLPVIRVTDDGHKKDVSKGIEEIREAIVEIVPYLGKDHSELRPVVVEVLDAQESRLLASIRSRKRRRGQGGVS